MLNSPFSNNRILPHLCLVGALFLWAILSRHMGPALMPTPAKTIDSLGTLLITPKFWTAFSITLLRASGALLAATALALFTGIAAGLSRPFMAFITPAIAILQSTPPILWITLLMVWSGTGGMVPFVVVVATLYPPLFAVVAQSTAHIPHAFFDTCRVHRIPAHAVLRHLILPGIFPGFLGGFSFALGTCWKTAAVAEFLGSSSGIGAQIYWSYRMLDMERLFAWGAVLIGLGLVLELGVIAPLKAAALTMKTSTPSSPPLEIRKAA